MTHTIKKRLLRRSYLVKSIKAIHREYQVKTREQATMSEKFDAVSRLILSVLTLLLVSTAIAVGRELIGTILTSRSDYGNLRRETSFSCFLLSHLIFVMQCLSSLCCTCMYIHFVKSNFSLWTLSEICFLANSLLPSFAIIVCAPLCLILMIQQQ